MTKQYYTKYSKLFIIKSYFFRLMEVSLRRYTDAENTAVHKTDFQMQLYVFLHYDLSSLCWG